LPRVYRCNEGVAKVYYYHPTHADPFITVVIVRGGQIDRLERTRKFSCVSFCS
jgi:hypothetical protein